jgi:hypothetical protein
MPRAGLYRITLFCCLAALTAPPVSCGGLPQSNLSIFQTLARDLGSEIARDLPLADSGSVALILHPQDRSWIVQGPIADALMAAGRRGMLKDGDVTAECTVSAMGVRYENSRRDSFLGERLVDRIVDLRLEALITDPHSGRIIHSGTYSRSVRDTIPISAIPHLEEGSIPATRGTLPEEGFFTWLAEPLILIGAVAVSIYLLFHVRS